MANLKERLAEAGTLWGLPPHMNREAVYGLKDGFPVQLLAGQKDNRPALVGLIRYDDPAQDVKVQSRIAESAEVASAGVKAKRVRAEDGILVYTEPFTFSWSTPKAEDIVARMSALLRAVQSVVPRPSGACRACKGPGGEAVLVNGLVDLQCAGCLQKLQVAAQEVQEVYDALPTNYALAGLTAAALSVVGAVLWAGLILLTNRMYFLLAMGIGMGIGWSVTRAAGKGGRAVQILGGVATVVSVVLGMALYAAALLFREAKGAEVQVDWMAFAEALPRIMAAMKGDLLFALAAGIFGAVTAAGFAARQRFDVKVERG